MEEQYADQGRRQRLGETECPYGGRPHADQTGGEQPVRGSRRGQAQPDDQPQGGAVAQGRGVGDHPGQQGECAYQEGERGECGQFTGARDRGQMLGENGAQAVAGAGGHGHDQAQQIDPGAARCQQQDAAGGHLGRSRLPHPCGRAGGGQRLCVRHRPSHRAPRTCRCADDDGLRARPVPLHRAVRPRSRPIDKWPLTGREQARRLDAVPSRPTADHCRPASVRR